MDKQIITIVVEPTIVRYSLEYNGETYGGFCDYEPGKDALSEVLELVGWQAGDTLDVLVNGGDDL